MRKVSRSTENHKGEGQRRHEPGPAEFLKKVTLRFDLRTSRSLERCRKKKEKQTLGDVRTVQGA